MEIPLKRKRGAPIRHGLKKLEVLLRACIALAAYQKVRMEGMTDRKAKEYACKEVKRKLPSAKISNSEVSRLLSNAQPKNASGNVFHFVMVEHTPATAQDIEMSRDLEISSEFLRQRGVIMPPCDPVVAGSTSTRWTISLLPRPRYRSLCKPHYVVFSKKFTKRA
jgi:hypothetical protein